MTKISEIKQQIRKLENKLAVEEKKMSRVKEIQKQIEELEKKTQELQKELELEKQKTAIEYPFEESENYFTVSINGNVISSMWANHYFDTTRYLQGNAFKTKEAAERERDRRTLLTRFRQFRDKCNGDWKPDWKARWEDKFCILFNHESSELILNWYTYVQPFESFGFFKNIEDANRAIELFGDEIKRLYLEG